MHGSELRHLELAALDDGVPELVREDAAEDPDGDCLRDVRRQSDMVVRIEFLAVEIDPGAEDHKGELVTRGDQRHERRDAHDDEALSRRRSDADDVDLKAERDHDEDGDDERERVHSDEGTFIAVRDIVEGVQELRVRVEPCACDEAAQKHASDGVGDQAEHVDDEDGGLALLGSGEEEQDEEEDEGGADLGTVADGQACAVDAEVVEGFHWDVYLAVVGRSDGD